MTTNTARDKQDVNFSDNTYRDSRPLVGCCDASTEARLSEKPEGSLQPKSSGIKDKTEKRRLSNRLSAQRWRTRKMSKFVDLQNQILILTKEHQQLEREASNLRAEFCAQLTLAQAEAAQLNAMAAATATRVQSMQWQELSLESQLSMLARATTTSRARRQIMSARSLHFEEKTHHHARSNWNRKQHWPAVSIKSAAALTGGGLHFQAELRALLTAAASPALSTLDCGVGNRRN